MKSVRWKRIELTYLARIQSLSVRYGGLLVVWGFSELCCRLSIVRLRHLAVHLRAYVRWDMCAGCWRRVLAGYSKPSGRIKPGLVLVTMQFGVRVNC